MDMERSAERQGEYIKGKLRREPLIQHLLGALTAWKEEQKRKKSPQVAGIHSVESVLPSLDS